ncbi:MAG: 3TM-type holin, partial [Betaproteobacteria bacterium]
MLDIGSKVIDRLWPDLQQSGELTQIAGQWEINKAEAGNPNPFTSGWRPFIG